MSASRLAPPVPPATRQRASSTNVRPPFTLASLGRRRSNSLLDIPPTPVSEYYPTPTTPAFKPAALTLSLPPPPPPFTPSPPSGLFSMVTQWIRAPHKPYDLASWASTPSSPRHSRASSDESILPMAASPTVSYFGDVLSEKQQAKQPRLWESSPSVHAPVLLVLLSFPLSTALVLLAMSSLPITVGWPRTLPDLAQLGRELHGYSQSGFTSTAHIVSVITVVTVWMHSWSIPGSVLANVLAGALFPPVPAILLLTTLTTLGSLSASILASPLSPFLTKVFPRALGMTRSALEGDNSKVESSAAWVRLSILRLVGVVPWSGINIACGVCGVAIWDCFLGAFIGSLPWTAVTCQIGDILQTVATTPRPTSQSVQSLLMSPDIIMKLVFLSFLSLAPILGRNRLKTWLSPSDSSEGRPTDVEDAEETASRWKWIKDWQGRIRTPSVSAVNSRQKEIEELVREKAGLPEC